MGCAELEDVEVGDGKEEIERMVEAKKEALVAGASKGHPQRPRRRRLHVEEPAPRVRGEGRHLGSQEEVLTRGCRQRPDEGPTDQAHRKDEFMRSSGRGSRWGCSEIKRVPGGDVRAAFGASPTNKRAVSTRQASQRPRRRVEESELQAPTVEERGPEARQGRCAQPEPAKGRSSGRYIHPFFRENGVHAGTWTLQKRWSCAKCFKASANIERINERPCEALTRKEQRSKERSDDSFRKNRSKGDPADSGFRRLRRPARRRGSSTSDEAAV